MKKKLRPNDYAWVMEDTLIPEHKHGQLDDSKNKLRDTATGEYVSIEKGNAIAAERLGGIFDCEVDRRGLLKAGGLAAGVMAMVSAEPRYAFAATINPDKTILVNIFLRGGADGLNILNPYNDPTYQKLRKNTKVNLASSSVINATYALSPGMKPLMEAWNAGELSFANAVGTKSGQSRSHFAEQASRDRAAPVQVRSGWIGRYLSLTTGTQPTFRAFTHGMNVAPSMYSDNPNLAMNGFNDFFVNGDSAGTRKLLQAAYQAGGGELMNYANQTLQSVNEVAAMKKVSYLPANGAVYKTDRLGKRMKEVAQVIKSNKGLEAVSLDMGGWDTHNLQQEEFEPNLLSLSTNLAAFRKDMGTERMKRVIVIVQSEFGRTTLENAASGTDHGMGSFVMVMSGKANPKTTVGEFPGLTPTASEKDMRVTTDYRDVMAEILVRGLGVTQVSQIFPGYTPSYKGVLKAPSGGAITWSGGEHLSSVGEPVVRHGSTVGTPVVVRK